MHGLEHWRVDVCTDNATSHDARHTMTLIHGAATRTIAVYARVRGDRPRKGRAAEQRRWWGEPSRSRSEIARENKEVAPRLSPLSLARPLAFARLFRLLHSWGPPLWARRISFLAQRRTEEIHRRDLVPFWNAEKRVKINYTVVSSRRYLRVDEFRMFSRWKSRPRTCYAWRISQRSWTRHIRERKEKFWLAKHMFILIKTC